MTCRWNHGSSSSPLCRLGTSGQPVRPLTSRPARCSLSVSHSSSLGLLSFSLCFHFLPFFTAESHGPLQLCWQHFSSSPLCETLKFKYLTFYKPRFSWSHGLIPYTKQFQPPKADTVRLIDVCLCLHFALCWTLIHLLRLGLKEYIFKMSNLTRSWGSENFIFCLHHLACGIFVSWPGIQPTPSAAETQESHTEPPGKSLKFKKK